jgi:hypothetical protein
MQHVISISCPSLLLLLFLEEMSFLAQLINNAKTEVKVDKGFVFLSQVIQKF